MLWSHGIGVGSALVVVLVGTALAGPVVFAERVAPGVRLGEYALTGLSDEDLAGAVTSYARQFEAHMVTVRLRGEERHISLRELGVTVDVLATVAALEQVSVWTGWLPGSDVTPILTVDRIQLHAVAAREFASVMTLPKNATLSLTPAETFVLVPGVVGESIDVTTLERDVLAIIRATAMAPLELVVISAPPAVLDHEVEQARSYAEQLLRDGFQLQAGDEVWPMQPGTVRRLLTFVEQVDPQQPQNHVLGVAFDGVALQEYVLTTVVPDIDQSAQDARFEMAPDEAGGVQRVSQFALPQQGRAVDVPASVQSITAAIHQRQTAAALQVTITEPRVADTTDVNALGVVQLLATGESDFVGSPRNRIHNITVGTSRYHGLLVPPGDEFSFNEFLGPVDGAHGFTPELVIKGNMTTPEFGGGLCQVSSTIFRAAVNSGLAVTERRNHSYAVRYYGTPGFDATIYPGHTDLRFINNTPGYILIQARIDGTTLRFEFWGTDDGRVVEVEGPFPYDRRGDGAVKATLTQRVTRDGQVMTEQTFSSRYKSPNLYPKVVKTDDPRGAAVAGAAVSADQTPAPPSHDKPTPTPAKPTPRPTPKPTPTPESST